MNPAEITLVLIVKNEEQNLQNCLSSFKDLWNHLIIVDTGSTDSTKQIAQQFGAEIHDFTWIDDFSSARNFALQKVKTKWTMMVDADDLIEPHHLQILTSQLPDVENDIIILPYHYDGQSTNSSKTLLLPRIWSTSLQLRYSEPIHEYLQLPPNTPHTTISTPILHQKTPIAEQNSKQRNLNILHRLHQKNPSSTHALKYLAREYFQSKQFPQAQKHYQQLLQQQNLPNNLKTEALYHLGRINLQQANIASAKSYFEQAVSNQAHIIEPYLFLIELEIQLFSVSKALQLIRQAKQIHPPIDGTVYDQKYYDGKILRQLENLALQKLTS